MLSCRRFADVLADARTRLGADVGRCSFIAVDFHHILLAGLPAHSRASRPAHLRRHQYVTCNTEGFSHFVTAMTAPIAFRMERPPGGACTHWKAPTSHGAHTYSGRCRSRWCTSQLGVSCRSKPDPVSFEMLKFGLDARVLTKKCQSTPTSGSPDVGRKAHLDDLCALVHGPRACRASASVMSSTRLSINSTSPLSSSDSCCAKMRFA